nr:MAG TPA: hypothetical protein [Caudoviricetes sp.]
MYVLRLGVTPEKRGENPRASRLSAVTPIF